MAGAPRSGEPHGRIDVLITGGGTAGHTNPGIAVAQALVTAGVDRSSIHFVGGERGNEATLVGEAGFSIDLLPGRGIRRSLQPGAVVQNIRSVASLVVGIVRAFGIVARTRPAVVLCLGGYAAFAATLAAVILRTPIVISEQNARASAVNRLFGRFATANALPYPDTDLPKGVLTGNPIRPAVVEAVTSMDRDRARAELGVDVDRVLIAVWAGSLGATKINRAVLDLASLWRDRADLAIHHVIGQRDWDAFADLVEGMAGASMHYQAVAYEDRMPVVQVGADLAICRAGASTTSEVAVAGLPSILVPLPHAPRDHQRANTRELETAGAAIVLDDSEVSAERLAELLAPLIEDAGRRAEMASAAVSVARPDAATSVAAMLVEQVDGESGRSRA